MDSTFIQARIDKTKELIVAYEDAVAALAVEGAQSYTLDTGQDRQTVTKLELGTLNRVLDVLYNRCAVLEARLNGGSTIVRPCW